MAKGQLRSNKEAKKPKKIKEPAPSPALIRGSAAIVLPKKKG
ncbi:hypothetical protein ACO2RV_03750 [Ancylobacter sp. VNQ12]